VLLTTIIVEIRVCNVLQVLRNLRHDCKVRLPREHLRLDVNKNSQHAYRINAECIAESSTVNNA
jgi:hypothetical protein